MLYSVLIYDNDSDLSQEEHDARLKQHLDFQASLREQDKLNAVVRLSPTQTAVTMKNKGELITDGPFAETKEQLIGFYVIQANSIEEATEAAKKLPGESGSLEIRPILFYEGPGNDGSNL